MTEDELELLRTRCRATAAETVLKLVVEEGRKRDRAFPRRLPTMTQWQEAGAQIVFPKLGPIYSTLYADEAIDAVSMLLERVRRW